VNLKCESCPQLDKATLYCRELQHNLENGYGMLHHSQHCLYDRSSLDTKTLHKILRKLGKLISLHTNLFQSLEYQS
jgi:hypothetical protein